MNPGERVKPRRKRWGRVVAIGFGLLLFAVATLHVVHGDYVMAPPSFLVAALLLYLGASSS